MSIASSTGSGAGVDMSRGGSGTCSVDSRDGVRSTLRNRRITEPMCRWSLPDRSHLLDDCDWSGSSAGRNRGSEPYPLWEPALDAGRGGTFSWSVS